MGVVLPKLKAMVFTYSMYARSQNIVQTTMETIDHQASLLMLTSATLPRTTDEENVFDGSNR